LILVVQFGAVLMRHRGNNGHNGQLDLLTLNQKVQGSFNSPQESIQSGASCFYLNEEIGYPYGDFLQSQGFFNSPSRIKN
jgi:hypothetical protein